MLIVGIGDSLTYGFPYSPRCSWLHIAGERIGVRTVNRGVCGETTGEMLARFTRDVLALKPQAAVIMGGSNDAFQHIAVQEVADNIRLMVDKAKAGGIIPLIALPLPCDYLPAEELLRAYRRWMMQHAKTQGVRLIDFYTPLLGSGEYGLKPGLTSDGVHPNEAGYALMADIAVPALQAVQDIQGQEQDGLVDKIDGQ
ncbi:MAG: SGNH/GDSL hydrolase family protein [Negativicutes bacterium]|nr:SGNH/GDSL hydrolase family protein [Negativicutes bacterium]